tara:strand:- start:2060 stop:2398 length:339 start_codon:yes stop_codon:yes gene_type:complete
MPSTGKELVIPNLDCILSVKDEEGNVLLEEEVIYIDHLVSRAQDGVNIEDENSVLQWLPKFTALVHEHYDCELSSTDAFFVAREATKLMWDIKKKYVSMLMSQQPTESTPSS